MLRQRQAKLRFDSNNAIARITSCPARAEGRATELREVLERGGMIGPRALSTRMFVAEDIVQKAFSSLISILLLR